MLLKDSIHTVDWEQEVANLVKQSAVDPDALEELMDYIVELTQEAYLRGKASRS